MWIVKRTSKHSRNHKHGVTASLKWRHRPVHFAEFLDKYESLSVDKLMSTTLSTLICRPQCNMAVYYCFSAPPQVTNTFPDVAFKFSALFGLPTCLFVRLSLPDNSTKMALITARYCNRKVQFFHEITDLWAKSLTVYLICDNGEHKASKEYWITQINKDYYFAREQLTRFRISYHTKFKVCPPHCIMVNRESLTFDLFERFFQLFFSMIELYGTIRRHSHALVS